MSTIPISTATFESLNVITVRVGTNCPAGGDSGHVGRTVFSITNDASTDLRVGINGEAPAEVISVEIVLGGEAASGSGLAIMHLSKRHRGQVLQSCISCLLGA